MQLITWPGGDLPKPELIKEELLSEGYMLLARSLPFKDKGLPIALKQPLKVFMRSGEMEVEKDGIPILVKPGDKLIYDIGEKFVYNVTSSTGAVFFEGKKPKIDD